MGQDSSFCQVSIKIPIFAKIGILPQCESQKGIINQILVIKCNCECKEIGKKKEKEEIKFFSVSTITKYFYTSFTNVGNNFWGFQMQVSHAMIEC